MTVPVHLEQLIGMRETYPTCSLPGEILPYFIVNTHLPRQSQQQAFIPRFHHFAGKWLSVMLHKEGCFAAN